MNYLIVRNYRIETPLIAILKKLKIQLFNNKLHHIEQRDDSDILVTCPTHKDGCEEHPSCHIYSGKTTKELQYGTYHCFTCGDKGSFITFVARCFDKSIQFAEQWLIDNFASEAFESSDVFFDDDIILTTKNKKYLDESILNNLQSWHPYMSQRKLSQDICKLFKVKYDPITKCIVFPVWDINNRLVMLTKRNIETKHFYIQKDCEKPVYLLNYIQQQNIDTVIVCESQINTLTCWSIGRPSIGLLGTGTKEQYEMLNKSCIKHYYLALDGDEAGDKGIARFIKNINKNVIVDVIILPRGKDINDLTQDELLKLKVINSNEWLVLHKKVLQSN